MAKKVLCLAKRPTHWQAWVCCYKQLLLLKIKGSLSCSSTVNIQFPSHFLHGTLVCQLQAYANFYFQSKQILHLDSKNINLTACPSSFDIHDSLSQKELVSTSGPAGTLTNRSAGHCRWHTCTPEHNASRILSFSRELEKAWCHPSASYRFMQRRRELQDAKAGAGANPESLISQLRYLQVSTLDRSNCKLNCNLGRGAATRKFCGCACPRGLDHISAPWPSRREAAAQLQQLLPRRQQYARVLRGTSNYSVPVDDKLSTLHSCSRLGGGIRQLHDGGVRRHSGAAGGASGSVSTQTIHGSYGSYNFDVSKPLGEGGYGAVFMGTNADTGQPVAIKTMKTRKILKLEDRSRTYVTREISALMQMRHPYIVHLYDVVFDPSQRLKSDRLYMVMELMSGGDMHALVMDSPGRMLPEDEARRFFQQLIQAVTFCHNARIFHRDLKPSNLLLDANKLNLKVADFGLSAVGQVSAVDPSGLLQSGVGTRSYMAPEVVTNSFGTGVPYHGGPADLWSCGIILFFLLNGQGPFDYNQSAILVGDYKFPPHFSKPVREILDSILKVDPKDRVTSEEIYNTPWFRVNFRPVDHHDLPGVQDNLDAISNLMHMPVDPADACRSPPHDVGVVLPRAPRSWVHRDEPIEKFTFGHSKGHESGPSQFLRDDVLTFFTTVHPQEILRNLQQLCRESGYRVETRLFNMTVWERGELPPWKLREPLCVIIDILKMPTDEYMVHFRRVTGSTGVYDQFAAEIVQRTSHFMSLRKS